MKKWNLIGITVLVTIFSSLLVAVPANADPNSAPSLDTSRNPVMSSLAEDASSPSGAVGTQIQDLVDSVPPSGQLDNFSDPDAGTEMGVAITGLNTSSCASWYYSDGVAWTNIGSVSDTSALLLPASAGYRIYCQPTENFSGTISAAITFRAWDQTSGTPGQTADTSINGGSSAFSSSSDSASLVVSAVNDAPILDASKSPSFNSIDEDSSTPLGLDGSSIAIFVDAASPAGQVDNVSDVDANSSTGIALTAVDTSNCSQWYFFDGSVWALVGSLSASSALLLPTDGSYRLYCKPVSNFNGVISQAITFRAWDQTSGTSGQKVDTTVNGGESAYSAATDTATLRINAMNDAPVLDDSIDLDFPEVTQPTSVPAGAVGVLVSSLVDLASNVGGLDNVTDVDTSPQLGIAIWGAEAAGGIVYFTVDGGTTWSMMEEVSELHALFLAADTQTRIFIKPSSTFVGTDPNALTISAWDRTTDQNGTYGDLILRGANTAFSDESDQISLTVNASDNNGAGESAPEVKVAITGYVQKSRSHTNDILLSKKRAKAVRSYLKANGLEDATFTIKGKGVKGKKWNARTAIAKISWTGATTGKTQSRVYFDKWSAKLDKADKKKLKKAISKVPGA